MAETKKNWDFNYQEIFRNIREKPSSLWILLGLIGLGLVLLFYGNDKGGSINQVPMKPAEVRDNFQPESAVSTRQQIEIELTQTLESISGVGKVKVELNLRSSSRKVWERQIHVDKRVSQEQGAVTTQENSSDEMVIAKSQDGRELPILKEELAPVIEGVIVVASGASDPKIKELLTNVVRTILGLPAHRIIVIAGRTGEETEK